MKKLISIMLTMGLLLTSTSSILINAAPVEAIADKTATSNEPTTQQLEAVIKKVRPLIDIPEELKEFDWYYNAGSYHSRPSWRLNWTDYQTAEVYVICDDEGRISSYNYYDYNKSRVVKLPEKSPQELLSVATDFIKGIAPYTSDWELVLDNVTSSSIYNSTYIYTFIRHYKGIPVPDNSISVTVNYVDESVESFDCSYNDGLEFAEPKNIITPEKAKEILAENQKMVLSYRLLNQYNEETGELEARKAYLVYTPEKSYVSVDAFTGKVYFERNTWNVVDRDEAGGGGNLFFDKESAEAEDSMASGSINTSYQLSEQELEQLEVLSKLISKDEAIKVITENPDLYIDKNATAVTGRLSKDYNVRPIINSDGSIEKKEDRYIWNLSFSNPSDADTPYLNSHMSAKVDAQDGTLISFSANIPGYLYYSNNDIDYPALTVSPEDAQKTAFAFIEKHQNEKSKSIRLSDNWDHTPIKYIEKDNLESEPVYGCQSFRYTRVNDGVDFTYNNFNLAVELITGKITSYSYSWYDDVEFEKVADAITPEQALMSLYSYDSFGLNYEINSDYTYNKYLADTKEGKYIDYDALYEANIYSRAVYSAYAPGTTTIRALDGKMINYNNEEYKPYELLSYSDIQGHWAEDTINRFSYINIGFEGGLFMPDKEITSKELMELFNEARIYFYTEDFAADDTAITRSDAVKCIIYALGYGKVAGLENVFITDFADGTLLKKQDVGHIAIARGFGIVEGNGDSFRPYDNLTRAEALTLIENVYVNELLN